MFVFSGVLKSIHSINIDKNSAYIKQTNNWVPFLDSLIQLNVLMGSYNGISKPKFIRNLKINVLEQEKAKHSFIEEAEYYNAQLDKTLGVTRYVGKYNII